MRPDENRAEYDEYLERRIAEDWDRHWLDQAAAKDARDGHSANRTVPHTEDPPTEKKGGYFATR